ncbi:TetR/AcrR family transcriptional regulator [Demequina sp. NBRC 110054]|uniref:TetR/AcrR family transcriptional regulator n=1 Tax=Demequina sp. NBRC 110054 TaxID=1570343 RepID=UPI00190EE2BE|nr:TetR/AcrR family transcriptional regulator [Demequina sp. NBRC 110054]
MADESAGSPVRRAEVLDAALRTFARYGYRKTSMDDVAREARISRPGLYFLFESKSGLFRAAADRGIELDLAEAEKALVDPGRGLVDRIVDAFDCWAGRYLGPMGDTAGLVEDNPDLLGPIAVSGPARFETVLRAALEREPSCPEPLGVARTLNAVSIGLKHQGVSRAEYRARMADAVRLMAAS